MPPLAIRIYIKNIVLLLLVIGTTSVYAVTDNDNNGFIIPGKHGIYADYSNDTTWVLGSEMDVSWYTTFRNVSLYLWQSSNSSSVELLSEVTNTTHYNFHVSLLGQFRLAESNDHADRYRRQVFFFQIKDANSFESFDSHYFNITKGEEHNSGKLSSGAEIGIGVGVGVGGLLLLAGAASLLFLFLRKRRAGRDAAKATSTTNCSSRSPRSPSSRFLVTSAVPNSHSHSTTSTDAHESYNAATEVPLTSQDPSPTASWQYSSSVSHQVRPSRGELQTHEQSVELPGDSVRAEMNASDEFDKNKEDCDKEPLEMPGEFRPYIV